MIPRRNTSWVLHIWRRRRAFARGLRQEPGEGARVIQGRRGMPLVGELLLGAHSYDGSASLDDIGSNGSDLID